VAVLFLAALHLTGNLGSHDESPTTASAAAQLHAADTWTQIWGDEFDGNDVDHSKWSTLRGNSPGYGSPFNRSIESAAYSNSNVAVNNGVASLMLRHKPAAAYGWIPYSSGMLQSGRHFNFKYGYAEARVRVPRCDGCWPAFWMLNAPVESQWPPEIDIFEYFNTNREKRPSFNFHYRSSGKKQAGPTKYGSNRSFISGWHTYGLLWTPTKLQVYLDGQPGPSFDDASKIPQVGNYLIFNLALQRGHNPRSGRKMLIDWVRVWQQQP
jgi:beta-glucanase (GH16 family)